MTATLTREQLSEEAGALLRALMDHRRAHPAYNFKRWQRVERRAERRFWRRWYALSEEAK